MSCPGLFRLDRVSVMRNDKVILDDVSIDILACGVTVLVGPSGSGKTTLLRLLNRLDVPDAGRILIDGVDSGDADPQQLRREVGMVFQTPVLFAGTVRENLGVARIGDDADYDASLREVGLDPARLGSVAARLSGGEAQRLCIARALRTGPRALLMDEPTSNLDTEAKVEIEKLAREVADAGTPIVWVTHDNAQVDRLADRVLELRAGKVVERNGEGAHERG